MTAECTAQPIVLQAGNDRTLVGRFNGGTICSDGGAILLQQKFAFKGRKTLDAT